MSSVSWKDRAPRNIHIPLTWCWTPWSSWKAEEELQSPLVHSTPVCCGTMREAHTPIHSSAAPPQLATCPPPSALPRASHGAPCPLPRPRLCPPLTPHPYLPSESRARQQQGPSRWCSQRVEEVAAVQQWAPQPPLFPLHLLLHLQATHTLSPTRLPLPLHPSLMINLALLKSQNGNPDSCKLLRFLQLFCQVPKALRLLHRTHNPILTCSIHYLETRWVPYDAMFNLVSSF